VGGPGAPARDDRPVITALQMKELRAELLAAGVFRHHEAASWRKLAILFAVLGASLTGVVLGPLWAAIVLVPIGAVCATTAVMMGHEGSHRSFSASPLRNHLLNYLAFPLFAGLGALYWRHKHDGNHHGHPNVDGEDPDIDLWPMTASQQAYQRSSRLRRWFQRNLQGYLFWPLTLLLPVMMRVRSILHLGKHARRHGVSRGWIADVACLAIHYTAWLIVPSLIWGIGPAIAVYLVLWHLVGAMLALIFAPAHMGLPVITTQNADWLHQLETTRNLRLPRWLVPMFVGLDHQIEHHLFPRIPHRELPRAATIVAAWCRRVGVPHQEIGYGAALVDVTRFMHDAWRLPARSGDEVRGGLVGAARAA
jgi:fatty acid desaturase